MKECHGQGAPPIQTQAARKNAVPKFVSLLGKYKLWDHPIYPPSNVFTDEDEFEKYRKAPLSAPDTDLVAFWEVRMTIFNVFVNS